MLTFTVIFCAAVTWGICVFFAYRISKKKGIIILSVAAGAIAFMFIIWKIWYKTYIIPYEFPLIGFGEDVTKPVFNSLFYGTIGFFLLYFLGFAKYSGGGSYKEVETTYRVKRVGGKIVSKEWAGERDTGGFVHHKTKIEHDYKKMLITFLLLVIWAGTIYASGFSVFHATKVIHRKKQVDDYIISNIKKDPLWYITGYKKKVGINESRNIKFKYINYVGPIFKRYEKDPVVIKKSKSFKKPAWSDMSYDLIGKAYYELFGKVYYDDYYRGRKITDEFRGEAICTIKKSNNVKSIMAAAISLKKEIGAWMRSRPEESYPR